MQMPKPACEKRRGITIIGLEPSSFTARAGQAAPSPRTEGWTQLREGKTMCGRLGMEWGDDDGQAIMRPTIP